VSRLTNGGARRAAAIVAVIMLGFGLGTVVPARAQQNSELLSLIQRVDRLQREVQDIQKQIVTGGGVIAPAGASAAGTGGDSLARAARTEVRIGALEDKLRGLTGQIQEIAHKLDLIGTRVDKLVADVDFRLTAIERAQAVAAAAAGSTPPPSAEATLEAPVPAGTASAATPPLPSTPGTLGTIPAAELGQGAAPTPATPPTAGAAATAALTPALPPGTPKQQYDYAFGLLRKAEYGEAERALKAFVDAYPDDALTGNAYYWLAETFYVRGVFDQASTYFAAGYRRFPDGAKAPDNLLKLAMSLARMGRKEDACLTFDELDQRFPKASSAIKRRAASERQRLACE